MTSFFAEDTGPAFERCPPGMHLARCYRIIDLGTQKTEYMGQMKYLRKIMLAWEIHGTRDDGVKLLMADGRPFSIFKNYTFSWSEKANLRLDLQSWRGKPFSQEEMRRFDLKNVLGAWCMLNIIERPAKTGNKIYSNVDGVTPVPAIYKQNGFPEAVNNNELFTLNEPNWVLFETFSDNLKAKISASPEFQKAKGGAPAQIAQPAQASPGFDDDDIPF